MKRSPEFHDARVVIVGPPGSGRADLLRAIVHRCGGRGPELVDGGVWSLLRGEAPSQGVRVDLRCLKGGCDYHGVQSALVDTADAVIVMMDVGPDRLVLSRRVFDALRPALEHRRGPWVVQYHRVEREPRFVAGRLDAWLKLEPGRRAAVVTTSDEPDVPGGAFDRLVEQMVEQRLV